MSEQSAEPQGSSRPSSGNGLLALLCTAQLVLTLDFSIVNVALPTIQRELHFSSANLQWIVTGYALTFGSLLLLSGRAGDLLGRRRLLVIGLVVFVVSSLTCGLARVLGDARRVAHRPRHRRGHDLAHCAGPTHHQQS